MRRIIKINKQFIKKEIYLNLKDICMIQKEKHKSC